jgi:hypothetical protein
MDAGVEEGRDAATEAGNGPSVDAVGDGGVDGGITHETADDVAQRGDTAVGVEDGAVGDVTDDRDDR